MRSSNKKIAFNIPSKEELLQYDCYFFDFDGVILESANIKTESFGEMYRESGIEKEVLVYHLANQGLSRYEKFRWIAQNIENRSISEEELTEKDKIFSQLINQKILVVPMVKGVLRLLKYLQAHGKHTSVVSGTPDLELKEIIRKRSLTSYFIEVHGSPETKVFIIEDFCMRNKLLTANCLFFGDASTDYEAAKATGTQFYSRLTSEMENFWKKHPSKYMSQDFTEIF